MRNNYAETLESYLIACEKISLSGIISKLPWKNNKSKTSKYDSMSDYDIAKRLVDGMKMNKCKVLDDSDPNTKTALDLTTTIANNMGQKYDIYRFF